MIKKWMRTKLLAIINSTEYIQYQPDLVTCESDTLRGDPVLNFKVYNAVGGKVVEFYAYDRLTDRPQTALYIVTDDDDFGIAIANIAMTQRLRT